MKTTPLASIPLPADFYATEKGNTLVVNDDGSIAAWLHLEGDSMLEVTDTPGNSPRLCIQVVQMTDAQLLSHLNSEDMAGWYVVRVNFEGQDQLRMDDKDGRLIGPCEDDSTTHDHVAESGDHTTDSPDAE